MIGVQKLIDGLGRERLLAIGDAKTRSSGTPRWRGGGRGGNRRGGANSRWGVRLTRGIHDRGGVRDLLGRTPGFHRLLLFASDLAFHYTRPIFSQALSRHQTEGLRTEVRGQV